MFYFYVKIILAIGQEFNILFLQHSWDFLLIFQVFHDVDSYIFFFLLLLYNGFRSPQLKGSLPGGSEGKVSACNAGDPGSIPGQGKIPQRRKWQPTPVLLPGKSHGWRSLAGYSPWGCNELDMTVQLHFHFHFAWQSNPHLSLI